MNEDFPIAGKFRKKPLVIEAMQIAASSEDAMAALEEWLASCLGRDWYGIHRFDDGSAIISIKTLEGWMDGDSGDWIIKGISGEFYPCKNDIFRKTYEPVAETELVV